VSLQIENLLQGMVKFEASDLHVKVGSPPGYRISGQIQPVKNLPALTPIDTVTLAKQLLTAQQFAELDAQGDLAWAHSVSGLARFRVTAMKQRGSISLFFRKIPVDVPDVDALGLPRIFKELVRKPRGLVLVTGPTACGKSTTLAAMIAHRNRSARGHILTIEDPVEFIHRDELSFVNQREVGIDTPSFASAIRNALRQDPDVILVGEMRDTETISLALTAVETGHLVLSSLTTTGAAQTLKRLVDLFPPDQQPQVRARLAEALEGVVTQVLVPRTGGGLMPAHEILIGTEAVRAAIRGGTLGDLRALIQGGGREGMVLLDTCLGNLAREGLVEMEETRGKVHDREAFERAMGAPA